MTEGPRIVVRIGLHQTFADALTKSGNPVPDPIEGVALIDTGAALTCIDETMAQKLGLTVIDTCVMHSASHSVQVNVYAISFETPKREIFGSVLRSPGMNLAPQGIIMLLGRDILSNCSLSYHGKTGTYSLHI